MGVHQIDLALGDQARSCGQIRRVERVPLGDFDVIDADAGGTLGDPEARSRSSRR